jgi:ribosomal protein L4
LQYGRFKNIIAICHGGGRKHAPKVDYVNLELIDLMSDMI